MDNFIDFVQWYVAEQLEEEALARNILDKLKIPAEFNFNNRKLLNEILEEQGVKKKDIEQVIREIDKLDKLPEKVVKGNLKKYGAEKILEIFKEKEAYFRKYAAYSEIKSLKEFCSYYGLKINFTPFLSRGLSYYNGTVFEVKTRKIKETICGGGAYMFNGIQAMGFGVSIERLSAVANLLINIEKTLVISLSQDKVAINLAQKLREQGKIVSLFFGKPSKALEYANTYRFGRVIFVGEKEVKKRKFRIKIMETGKEIALKI